MGLYITVDCETAAVSLVFALFFGTDSRIFELFEVFFESSGRFFKQGILLGQI